LEDQVEGVARGLLVDLVLRVKVTLAELAPVGDVLRPVAVAAGISQEEKTAHLIIPEMEERGPLYGVTTLEVEVEVQLLAALLPVVEVSGVVDREDQ
jgi:hypothetical protein